MSVSNNRAASGTGAGRYGLIGSGRGGSAQSALSGADEMLGRAVVAVVGAGDAIFIGSTRDRSAVFVRVLSELGNEEWYEGSSSGLISTLDSIREAAETVTK